MPAKKPNHLNLLCHIGDLANLIIGTTDIQNFLQQTVELVACHLNASVGSIYLYDESSKDLVLKATVGLNPKAVGVVRMKSGEGLVGQTFEQIRPMREGWASRNPHFKYFKEAREDPFESFLAIPLQRGEEKIGVLVVQHEQRDYFTEIDVMALRAIAAQLVGAIENARLMIDLDRQKSVDAGSDFWAQLKFLKGQSASKGYALAPCMGFQNQSGSLLTDRTSDGFATTLDSFQKAVAATIDQLKRLQERLSLRLPESAALIFESHFMILKDRRFLGEMKARIKNGALPAAAVRQVALHFIDLFGNSPNAYMREKTVDIEDLARRILHNLRPSSPQEAGLTENRIVIARELFPSDLLKLASESVAGLILVGGGITSHVAIIARSLKIPMVISDRAELLHLPVGTKILLDADIGGIYVQPTEKIIRQFEARNAARHVTAGTSRPMAAKSRTRCGVRVKLLANINLLSELELAKDLMAEGVGLYRTEFPFLIRSFFPSEEEQYLVYRRLIAEMAGRDVTFRTLDIGGDKVLPYLNAPAEANPELGLRSIRFSLRYPDIFEGQLRAILRAGAEAGRLKIMFPMISSLDEFQQIKQSLATVLNHLDRQGLAHHRTAQIGLLIELPAVLDIISELAAEADFFSIGTNDFIQYMLAVDRTNEKVADYYQPGHPAVLRGLNRIVTAVKQKGKEIGVCGEMGHEADWIPFLIGIGLRSLSVDPQFLPLVQETIAAFSLAEASAYAAALLAQPTLEGIRSVVNDWRNGHFRLPDKK